MGWWVRQEEEAGKACKTFKIHGESLGWAMEIVGMF